MDATNVTAYCHAISLVRREVPHHLSQIIDPHDRDLIEHFVDVQMSDALHEAYMGIALFVGRMESHPYDAVAELEGGVRSAVDLLIQLRDDPMLRSCSRILDNLSLLIGFGELLVGRLDAEDAEPI